MNYILSEDQYQSLIKIAHEQGLDEIEALLRTATPHNNSDDQNMQRIAEQVRTVSDYMSQKYGPQLDIDDLIAEDRNR